MPEPVDVLLVTTNRQFTELAGRQRPSAAQFRSATPQELERDGPIAAQQLWIDLDSVTNPPAVGAPRRVYFYSALESIPSGLPPGMFIRKPCAPVIFEVLWADVRVAPGTVLTPESPPTGRALPDWLLEFQELRLATLCRKMITGLAPRLGYQEVSLYLHDQERGVLTLAETTHSRPAQLSVPMSAASQHLMVAVARSGRIFRTEHAPEEAAARGIARPELRTYTDDACLVAPLCSEGQLWGVLNFSGRLTTPLTDKDAPLEQVFYFLGRMLHHARAFDLARTEARVDSLTGLYNQRWIMESLEREIRRAERFGTPLSVLMVDLDGLKTINDQQGHAAGDCVLRHVAGRIARVLRQFDGAARVGGDEFVVMLPATNLRGAQRVARRLVDLIRKEAASFRSVALPITASVGAAEWQSGWNATQLIDAADRAMYGAKPNGRGNGHSSAAPAPATAGSDSGSSPPAASTLTEAHPTQQP